MATEEIKTLSVVKELLIAAPADVVFETVLEPHGPMKDMNMKLEPWPGGRWFRDLGNNTGHLWGHVQVIKPPKVLELVGPTMMSYPAISHIQYRLTEQAGGTLLKFTHQAMGMIEPGLEQNVSKGWGEMLELISYRRPEKTHVTETKRDVALFRSFFQECSGEAEKSIRPSFSAVPFFQAPSPDLIQTIFQSEQLCPSHKPCLVRFEHMKPRLPAKFLERVPQDKLMWKPHEKSHTAGALALHIAVVPGLGGSALALADSSPVPDFAKMFKQPTTVQEILGAHEKSIETVRQTLPTLDDARLMTNWSATAKAIARHDHPQGDASSAQTAEPLDPSLRLIRRLSLASPGAKVPSSYGPSGDEGI